MADLSQQVPLGLNEADYTLAQLQAAHDKAYAARDDNAVLQLREMIQNKQNTMRQTAAEGSGFGEQFARGYGQAIPRMAEGVANWMGAEGKFHIPGVGTFDSTREGLLREDERNKALLATTGGQAGNIAGQIVGTAPLGMGTGALARGAGLAGKEILTNPTFLQRALALGGRAAIPAGEGAVQAGSTASPGEQGEAAEQGAILNLALRGAGKVGGRALSGVVQKSPAAQALIDAAKEEGQRVFLPISLAAQRGGLSGAVGSVYRNLVPLGVGVEGRVGRQTQQAVEDVQQAHRNMWETTRREAQQTAQEHAAGLKDSFDSYIFNLPLDYKDQVTRYLNKMHPDMPDFDRDRLTEIMVRNASQAGRAGEYGAEVSGGNLRRAMDNASKEIDAMGPGINANWKNSSLQTMRDIVDQSIREHEDMLQGASPKEADRINQFLSDMQRYKGLAAKDADVASMVRNTEGAPPVPGDYTFTEALRGAAQGSPEYRLLQNAHNVLESGGPASSDTDVKSLLREISKGLLPLGVTGGGMLTGRGNVGLALSLAGEGLATGASTQGAQRALYGDLSPQQALANYLRRNPAGAYSLGQAGRAGVTGYEDDQSQGQQ